MLSGFTRLPSKSKTWSQRKRSSMSRRLLNLLMLSGSSEEDRKAHVERYGGYMLRAKLCVARCVTLRAVLRMMWHMMLRAKLVQSADVVRLHSASLEEQNMETAQALNLLMSSGSSEADRETRVARCGGCVLRAKLCVARCVTLRAILRMMRHVLLRVRLRVVFASAGGVVRVRLWRWLLALPELCARIQAKAQTALFLLVACARSLRSATSRASLPELLMSYATRRTHKESRVPPRRLEVPRSSLKSPESDHQDARPPTSMSRQTGIARASETSASASQPR